VSPSESKPDSASIRCNGGGQPYNHCAAVVAALNREFGSGGEFGGTDSVANAAFESFGFDQGDMWNGL